MFNNKSTVLLSLLFFTACSRQLKPVNSSVIMHPEVIQPAIITEKVGFDSDDPAIWINPADASKSLVIGTDKSATGGLYVFDLQGKIQNELVVKGLQRPNNVDIAYHLN